MNRAAIKSMVDIALGQFLRAMNLTPEQVRNFEGFTALFQRFQELLIPDFMNVTTRFNAPDTLSGQFNEKGCFA